MYCKNCGAALNEGASVCMKCGVRVGVGSKYCPNCAAQPDPLAVVCVQCGALLNKKQSISTKEPVVNNFGSAVSVCFKKYATFSGRANRAEYWYFRLFYIIISLITYFGISESFSIVFDVAFLLPNLAVAVRRLHDIGKSGWNYLFNLIPIVGTILVLVWLCQPSQEAENEYGLNPNE